MEVPKTEIRAGDAILWKGGGPVDGSFSFILGLFFPDWRKRKWKPWHTGFVIRVLDDGEIVTFQAVAKGVHAITYPDAAAMGDCKIYAGWIIPTRRRSTNMCGTTTGGPTISWAISGPSAGQSVWSGSTTPTGCPAGCSFAGKTSPISCASWAKNCSRVMSRACFRRSSMRWKPALRLEP